MDYIGVKCPVCEKMFDKDHDVVVCPICGTPYHRTCYNIEGKCLREKMHGTEQGIWVDPRQKDREIDEELHGDFALCPRCLNKNKKEALTCSSCGKKLDCKSDNPGLNGMENDINAQAIKALFDPLGGVDPKESFNGIIAEDMAKFVKSNTRYYIKNFKVIKDTGKSSFNFCAFLFSGMWMIYRKQYKAGVPLTILIVVLMMVSKFILDFMSGDIYNEILSSSGVQAYDLMNPFKIPAVLSVVSSMTIQNQILYWTPKVLNLLTFIIDIVVGAKANKMYFNHCVSKMLKLKEKFPSREEFLKYVDENGGVNLIFLRCVLLCIMAIHFVTIFFM